MSKYVYILSLSLGCLFVGAPLSAQNNQANSMPTGSIFDQLEDNSFGKGGEITIHQPEALKRMVGAPRQGTDVEQLNGQSYLKMQGYRTQVFSGNNQRSSKDEAFRKEKEINEVFPGVPTYVTYSAPFWKLRVGDFRSHEEAYYMKLELAKAFPSFGKEMYIVREEIRIPLY